MAEPQPPPSSLREPLDDIAHNVGSIGKTPNCQNAPESSPS
jgi:hypothetical protein